ncbi:hypothetical protein WJX74_002745 [Apatococcus lobatus]|uniref:Cyclic nucleotide-binding domain-containing protein n=1 Tax=Apatococcus lobatus TaxID=904363 RepID=A0AAW1RS72_9CHLO
MTQPSEVRREPSGRSDLQPPGAQSEEDLTWSKTFRDPMQSPFSLSPKEVTGLNFKADDDASTLDDLSVRDAQGHLNRPKKHGHKKGFHSLRSFRRKDSAGSMAESTATDSTSATAAQKREQFMADEDHEPLGGVIARRMSVTRQQWNELNPHLTPLHDLHERDPLKLDHDKLPTHDTPKKRQRWSKKSILGLPTRSPLSRPYKTWSSTLLLLDLTYTAFIIPLGVGFNSENNSWDWFGIVDFIAGCFFATDLFLGFHIGFIATHNLRKRVVLDGRAVARYYTKHGSFAIDLMSTLVWIIEIVAINIDTPPGSSSQRIISILQALRALRLLRLIRVAKHMFVASMSTNDIAIPGTTKTIPNALAYLLQIFYGLAVLINFLGCLWAFTAIKEGYTNTWISNNTQFMNRYSPDGNSLTKEAAMSIPSPYVWLVALYWAMTTISTIGYGDITPQQPAETAIALAVELLGVLIFGVLLGSITELLSRASRLSRRAALFRQKMVGVNDYMGKRKMPRKIRNRIKSYYAEVWVRQKDVEAESEVFHELPHRLRTMIAWHFNESAFHTLSLFEGLKDELLFQFASRMQPIDVSPGHELVKEGDPADSFFILHEGECDRIFGFEKGGSEYAPTIIGAPALLQSEEEAYRVRPCTVRAKTVCRLWELKLRDFLPLAHHTPGAMESMVAQARELTEATQGDNAGLWERSLQEIKTSLGSEGEAANYAHLTRAVSSPMPESGRRRLTDDDDISMSQGLRQSFTEGDSMRLTADALMNLKASLAAEDLSPEQIQQQLAEVVANLQAQTNVQRGGSLPLDGSLPGTPTAAEAAANEEANARTQNSVAPSMPGIAEDGPVTFSAEDLEEAIMAGSKTKQVKWNLMRETLSGKEAGAAPSATTGGNAPRTPLQAAALESDATRLVRDSAQAPSQPPPQSAGKLSSPLPSRITNDPNITTGTVFAQLIALTDQMEAMKAMMNRNASMMVNMLDNRPASGHSDSRRLRHTKSSPFDFDEDH